MLQCLVAKFETINLVQTTSESLGMHLRNRRKVILRLSRCFQTAEMRIWFKAVLRITDPELETEMHSHMYLLICRINKISALSASQNTVPLISGEVSHFGQRGLGEIRM